jgi:hypothetical protein
MCKIIVGPPSTCGIASKPHFACIHLVAVKGSRAFKLSFVIRFRF